MGFLKFLIWTSCAMALGIYISTARYDGGTPLEQLQRVWKQHGPRDTELGSKVRGAVDSAREAVSKKAPPTEHFEPEDREAVNKLIAGRSGAK